MIKTLTLGQKTYPNNICQGPLAGVSTAPFRALSTRLSQPAFTCSEMISCKTLIHQPSKAQTRLVAKDPAEGALCYQLSGSDPAELAEAVKRVTDYGADSINLNCGCPVKKIRSRGAGSKLLSDANKIGQLINAMKASTHLPVSIKIRVDSVSGDQYNQEIAKMVRDSGLDYLVVHGRHYSENYEQPVRYDEIAYFVDELTIPVIGNGDIKCLASLKQMLATGCHGVMIARAGVGQPWLIAKLIAEANGDAFVEPTIEEIGHLFLEHIQKLSLILENDKFAILQARKFAKYYARKIPERALFIEAINTCEDLTHLQVICQQYFMINK